MNSYYGILADFQLKHSYYMSGRTEDFQIQPAPGTEELLHAYGLRYVQEETGFRIAFRGARSGMTVTPDVPFAQIPSGLKLSFYLKLVQPAFMDITDLSGITLGGKILHYSGGTVDGDGFISLVRENISCMPMALGLEFSPVHAVTAVTLTLQSLSGPPVTRTWPLIAGADGKFRLQEVLKDVPAGRYSLTAVSIAGTEYQENLYLSDEIARRPCFGVIELVTGTAWQTFTPGSPLKYKVQFAHRSLTSWKYILVNRRLTNDPPVFLIEASAPADDDNAANRYTGMGFTISSAAVNPPAYAALGSSITVFTATRAAGGDIPLYEERKQGVTLKLNGSAYMRDLPKPRPDSRTGDIIIYI